MSDLRRDKYEKLLSFFEHLLFEVFVPSSLLLQPARCENSKRTPYTIAQERNIR